MTVSPTARHRGGEPAAGGRGGLAAAGGGHACGRRGGVAGGEAAEGLVAVQHPGRTQLHRGRHARQGEEPRLTAAIPVEKPCCSCKLTRSSPPPGSHVPPRRTGSPPAHASGHQQRLSLSPYSCSRDYP